MLKLTRLKIEEEVTEDAVMVNPDYIVLIASTESTKRLPIIGKDGFHLVKATSLAFTSGHEVFVKETVDEIAAIMVK